MNQSSDENTIMPNESSKSDSQQARESDSGAPASHGVSPRNEELFQLTVNSIRDYAIFVTDLEGVVQSWNHGVEEVLGYSEAGIVGQHISLIFTPEDVSAGAPQREMKRAEIEGRAEDKRWHVRRDGTRFWANGLVMPLRDEAGAVRGFAKVMRDDTEHKLFEEEREQLLVREQEARRQAERADRVKDDFLATLSHELRTPLTSILGWSRMLRSGTLDADASAHALEIIERNARSQSQLIEDILDVSRIISGKLRLDVRQTDLASAIDGAIDAVRAAAAAKNIRLQIGLDPGAGLVSGDPDRLQQVIWNLLSNAIKFTPKQGHVEISLDRVGSEAQIRVSDSGQGIETEFLPHVFDRFRQADASTTRAQAGLGLGLAIVRHLVELHGGTVSAESEGANQGATFVVRLPLAAVIAPNKETLLEIRAAAVGNKAKLECPPELDGLQVLVVDDEEDARELIAVVLEKCGAEVVAVESVREALVEVEKRKPDVIVSDIGMPGEDGYALIERVREREAERGENETPAAALTAFARAEDRMRVLRSGFQIHIPKPVEPAELVTVVANLAGRNRKAVKADDE